MRKTWLTVALVGFIVAILGLWVALTAGLESYIHDHPGQSWEAAITATSTLALVIVTAVYVFKTNALVRNSDPRRLHRAATQEEAARDLLRFHSANADVLRDLAGHVGMASEYDHLLSVNPERWEERRDRLSDIEDRLEIFGVLLPSGVSETCDEAHNAIAFLVRCLILDIDRIHEFVRTRPARAEAAAAEQVPAAETPEDEEATRERFVREYLLEPPTYAELREWLQGQNNMKLFLIGADATIVERAQEKWKTLRTRLIEYLRGT